MSFFRITLHRSAIGLPKQTGLVLKALGLKRRGQTVFHPVNRDSAGMVLRVKELVMVEEVDARKTKQQVHEEQRPDPGFVVESRLLQP
jgi:large subunit ribosomal protein L30